MEPTVPTSCFVISPIGDEKSEERRHADMVLHRIIEPAFSDILPKCKVVRADKYSSPGSIPDRIVRSINESDICIADLSFLNSNVFYELGICHALRKVVVHMAKYGTKLPFDNYQQYTIFFDPFEHHELLLAADRVKEAVKQTMQEGFVLTNPVINSLAFASIDEKNSPNDIILKDLYERIETISNRVSNIEPTYYDKYALFKQRDDFGLSVKDISEMMALCLSDYSGELSFDAKKFEYNINKLGRFINIDMITNATKFLQLPPDIVETIISSSKNIGFIVEIKHHTSEARS